MTKFYATLILLVLTGAAACDRSERADVNDEAAGGAEQPVLPQQEMDPETMQQMMEIQQIRQELEPIQQEALQDEALASRLESIQLQIETAMRSEDSEVVDRMDRLRDEMARAQAAGDQERMQALMGDAEELQQEVQALQAAVFERPEIRQSVEEFEAANRARMIEIDPQAEALLDRMDELMAGLPR